MAYIIAESEKNSNFALYLTFNFVMAQHNDLGKRGEQLAFEFLKDKGYKIIARNWKLGKYEIDIIAQYENEIVFVEVKTRSTDYFGNPEDAVDYRRQCRMTNAADAYLRYTKSDFEPRFDIISIILNDSQTIIDHIENAFPPVAYYY